MGVVISIGRNNKITHVTFQTEKTAMHHRCITMQVWKYCETALQCIIVIKFCII